MSSETDRHGAFTRHWWGYGIGALVLLNFAQPTLAFVSPAKLFLVGSFILAAVSVNYWADIYPDGLQGKLLWYAKMLLLPLVAAMAASALYDAGTSASPNEQRCAAIQKDMLSAVPRKKDGAALFQALGCHPHGEGSVMVPATRSEYLAAHPRPASTLLKHMPPRG